LINIPTGLGKTAAVVLACLWNRVQLQKREWPVVSCIVCQCARWLTRPQRTYVVDRGIGVGE
jgi:hypothetical protein